MLSLVALYALLAAMVNCCYSVFTKLVLTRSAIGAFGVTLIVEVLTGAIALPLLLIGRIPPVGAAIPYMLLVCLCSMAGYTLTIAAFARDDVSSVGPIFGLKVIFLAVMEMFAGSSEITGRVIGAAVLSLVGVALLSQTDRWSLRPRDLLREGVILMALGALVFAVSDILMNVVLVRWGGNSWAVNLYFSAMLALFAIAVLGVLCALGKRVGRLRPPQIGEFRQVSGVMIACAVTIFLTQYLIFSSIAAGHQVTITNILYNIRGIFMVVLMAVLVLGRGSKIERAGWRAYTFRTAGALVTLGAIVLALMK